MRFGELSAATAQNYVSAANRVMEISRDGGIPKRSGIATESLATSEK